MPTTYLIPEANVEQLRREVAILEKRALKLGVATFSVRELGTITKTEQSRSGIDIERLYFQVEVEGTTPRLAGWAFLATLNHLVLDDGSKSVLVKTVPGVELPQSYRQADPENCDHCHTSRRRVDTFVLRHEDGTYKQVGRQCLVDFLGGANPETIVKQLQLLARLSDLCGAAEDEGWSGSDRSRLSFSTLEYLTAVAACIRAFGWTSRKTAREGGLLASADAALQLLTASPEEAASFRKAKALPVLPEDAEVSEKALEWAQTSLDHNDPKLSDYEFNLSVAISGARLDRRAFGIAASCLNAYSRALGYEAERRAAGKQSSGHFGEVGTRYTFTSTVTVITIRPFTSDWGYGTVVKASTPEGQHLVWFEGANPENIRIPEEVQKLVEGDCIFIKGTVKAHKEYKGNKETQLSRVTQLSNAEAEAEAEKLQRKAARAAKKAATQAKSDAMIAELDAAAEEDRRTAQKVATLAEEVVHETSPALIKLLSDIPF